MKQDPKKIGKYEILTESYLLDFNGKVPLSMIGNYLVHAASSHASECGYGFNEMAERHTAWVLSKLAIEILEYPSISEKLTLYTWIEQISRYICNRNFEIVNANGKQLALARSIWAAINIQTRRPTSLLGIGMEKFLSDKACPISTPIKIRPLSDNYATSIPYGVKYSDLDLNKHVNSIKYIEHMLDLFELDMYKTSEIKRLEVNYYAEAQYGMQLTLHKQLISEKKYNLAIRHEDKVFCRAAVTWK